MPSISWIINQPYMDEEFEASASPMANELFRPLILQKDKKPTELKRQAI